MVDLVPNDHDPLPQNENRGERSERLGPPGNANLTPWPDFIPDPFNIKPPCLHSLTGCPTVVGSPQRAAGDCSVGRISA